MNYTVLARQLLNKHGLHNWRFKYSRSKLGYGHCSPRKKEITLSRPLSEINSHEENLDTILHEIAHALDWERNRKSWHGYTWKAICREVGARPERCYGKEVNTPKEKYHLIHKDTREVFGKYHRLPSWAMDVRSIGLGGKPETKGKLLIVNA